MQMTEHPSKSLVFLIRKKCWWEGMTGTRKCSDIQELLWKSWNIFGCDKVILTVEFNVTYSQAKKKNCHVFELEKLGRYTSRWQSGVCNAEHKNLFHFRHYRQAYSLLGELKSSDINMLEIKVVAGFVNYKVCVFRV